LFSNNPSTPDPMRRARWLAPWKDSSEKPVIYHCITRVVERRLAFEARDKEQFRTYMRMYENFSGCRVLSYCLMGKQSIAFLH